MPFLACLGVVTSLMSSNFIVFNISDSLDENFLRPTAQIYSNYTPLFIKDSVTNFFYNLAEIDTVINQLLQGKPRLAAEDSLRFVINTKLLYANYENYFNVKILTPYSEGPMVNFFYNYKLKFKEIFFIKDLQNYIIKKHENRSFWALQIFLKSKYKLANFLKNKKKNVKKKQSKLKIEKYADFKKIKFNSKKIESIKSKLSNFCKNEDELLRLNNLLVYLDNK